MRDIPVSIIRVHSGTDPSVHLTPKLKNRYHPLVAILLFEVTRDTL